MTTTGEFAAERAQLGLRDRDELHEIASAMGVRGATRLRKADLIEAILDKATSGASVPEPSGEKPKKRATRRKAADAEAPAASEAGGDGPAGGGGENGDAGRTEAGERSGGDRPEPERPAPDRPAPDRPAPDRPAPDRIARGSEPSAAGPAEAGEPQRLRFGGSSEAERAGRVERAGRAEGGRTEVGGGRAESGGDQSAQTVGAPAGDGGASGATASGGNDGSANSMATAPDERDDHGARSGGGSSRPQGVEGDGRDGFGEGRGRRRRRRGRDRGFEGSAPSEGSGAQHPRERERERPQEREREREPRPFEPAGEPIEVQGLLEIRDEGYGFMRTGGFLAGRSDVYVSASQIRRFGMRKGDYLKGATRPAASNEKYPALLRLDEINGQSPEEARSRPRFEDLTPLFPDEKLRLEQPGEATNGLTGRIVDLVSPIGKGQRGLIVSPPKAGKTTIMKQIVHSIERNNPEVHLIVLLVDERPEEVTDMRRHVLNGEVVASTFDRPAEEHTQVAELAIERAKRLVETGKDVVIILDGITRLARAYNLAAPASGRILSGGVDSGALYPPKKFFGAARNIEEGGSLTILATALIETGSRMDEVIFEEFKGTGNMELRLDRRLAERRIYPAIDVEASSTRHEELLFDRVQLQQVWKLRRVLNALEGGAGLELLMDKIKTTRSNDEFLAEIAKAPTAG
jgi:transcription termination factor Rho